MVTRGPYSPQTMTTMAKQYVFRGRFLVTFLTFMVALVFVFVKLGWLDVRLKTVYHSTDVLAKDTVRLSSSHEGVDVESRVFYGIMFDAGSTGSRVHIYQFRQDSSESPLRLMNETFEAIKPGLSSYRLHPDKGAQSLKPLLDIAMTKVPAGKRSKTPVALKATAGLRLLPGNLADIILNKVGSVIKEYPFRSSADSVQIMDGTDEGIFSWMTVNFLLGSLSGKSSMVAALDLGGGSTQITFVPNNESTYQKAPQDFIKKVNLFSKTYRLYTHSYLGLGLMSARFQIMGGEESSSGSVTKQPSAVLSSPCLPPGHMGTFEHQGHKYTVTGLAADKSGFQQCYNSVRNLIVNQGYHVNQVAELNDLPVYIFSYYYDRAVETHLIDAQEGGVISLSDYKTVSESACRVHTQTTPYLCMDVTYMYSLLHDGFGLKDNKKLHLKKKINSVEISWALGAMFDMLDSSETQTS